jgi:F0F1-type ATP synthase assembly protein I
MLTVFNFMIMHHQMRTSRSCSRSTFGEALIVISVVGFFVAFMNDKVSLQDVWILGWFLTLIVGFYMALLFCRMLFFWMTGDNRASYPWWKHAEMAKKIKD